MRASAFGAESRRFESCHGYVSRKHPTPTPEASASQLLSELREMNRTTRETMADLKSLLKEVKEVEKNILDIIQDINNGVVHNHIETLVQNECAGFADSMAEHTQRAQEQITDRLSQMTAALIGLPAEVLSSGSISMTATRTDFPFFPASDSKSPKKS